MMVFPLEELVVELVEFVHLQMDLSPDCSEQMQFDVLLQPLVEWFAELVAERLVRLPTGTVPVPLPSGTLLTLLFPSG